MIKAVKAVNVLFVRNSFFFLSQIDHIFERVNVPKISRISGGKNLHVILAWHVSVTKRLASAPYGAAPVKRFNKIYHVQTHTKYTPLDPTEI